jgi:tRNA threonylcarbamoyladenosine biosynthesis protein TsaE
MDNRVEITVHDLAGTESLGRRLADLLFGGAVVAMVGPLGAGKTHLVRAIAQGLGVSNSRLVNSPTFVLIQEYVGQLPIYHFDAYRLRNSGEFTDLGAHEYFEGKGVCLVEWADRVEDVLPPELLRIKMQIIGEFARKITLGAQGSRYQSLLKSISL